MKKLKEQVVSKIIFTLLITAIISCNSNRPVNPDVEVLKAYLQDYRQDTGKDTLFLEYKNSNSYLLSRIDKYLELKRDSLVDMPKMISHIDYKTGERIFIEIKKGDSTYNRLLSSRKIELDPLVHKIFSESEYVNYRQQISDSSTWGINYNKHLKNVFAPTEATDKEHLMHISKPVYTKDSVYALIYRSSLPEPYIYIYQKEKNTWLKVHSIAPEDY